MKITSLKYSILLLLASVFASAQAQPSDWVYYAKQGDTLWDLCLQYTNKRGCWIELARHNQIDNDRRIPLNTAIRIPLAWLKQPPVLGRVSHVSGQVSYRRYGGQDAAPLTAGQLVHLGGAVITGEGSATLLLDNHHQVLVRPHSVLQLNGYSGRRQNEAQQAAEADITLMLQRGSTEARVKKAEQTRFRIQTPTAIAAVRGTEFRVSSDAGPQARMRTEVLTGGVAVSTGQNTADVPAGFGIAVNKGEQVAAPKQLLAAPVFSAELQPRYSDNRLPITVGWRAAAGAAGYQLDLASSGDDGGLLDSYRTDAGEQQIAALAQGCYQLTVSAFDGEGFQGLSSRAALCVVPRLATPVLDGQGVRENRDIAFNWKDVPDATGYRVELAADENFAQPIASYQVAQSDILLPGKGKQSFYLRVTAEAGDQVSSDPSAAVHNKADNTGVIIGLLTSLLVAIAIF